MKVYVVERDVYEQRYVVGIYATLEAAMAANPVKREGVRGDPYRGHCERPGGWQPDKNLEGWWWNGLDGGEHATIYEHEVQG